MANSEIESLKAQLKAAQDQAEAYKKRLANARVAKEKSDFFADAEGEPMSYKNLSETKRYFESNHPEVLAALMKQKKALLNSKDFHAYLSTLVK